MSIANPAEGRTANAASPEEVRSGGGLMIASGNLLATVIPIVVIMLLWELAVRLSNVPPADPAAPEQDLRGHLQDGLRRHALGRHRRHARCG